MSVIENPRPRVVELLNTLGDPDDAVVLAAARELDRLCKEGEGDWSKVLTPNLWWNPLARYQDRPIHPDDLVPPEFIQPDLALVMHLRALDLEPELEAELEYIEREIRRDRYILMDYVFLRAQARERGVPIPEVQRRRPRQVPDRAAAIPWSDSEDRSGGDAATEGT